MMLNLIIHPEADKEYSEARMWYEVQKNDLGKRFELSVETIIKKIQATPEFFKYAKRDRLEKRLLFYFLIQLFIK